MGVAKPVVYTITIPGVLTDADGEDEDLVMRVSGAPMDRLLEHAQMDLSALDLRDLTPEALARAQEAAGDGHRLFASFAEALWSWNLEKDDGSGGVRPVPTTLGGLLSQDSRLVGRMVVEWLQALGGIHGEPVGGSDGTDGTDGVTAMHLESAASPPMAIPATSL